jgi:hypothetical protein
MTQVRSKYKLSYWAYELSYFYKVLKIFLGFQLRKLLQYVELKYEYWKLMLKLKIFKIWELLFIEVKNIQTSTLWSYENFVPSAISEIILKISISMSISPKIIFTVSTLIDF